MTVNICKPSGTADILNSVTADADSLCHFDLNLNCRLERSNPLKPFHRFTDGPCPLKTIETNGTAPKCHGNPILFKMGTQILGEMGT